MDLQIHKQLFQSCFFFLLLEIFLFVLTLPIYHSDFYSFLIFIIYLVIEIQPTMFIKTKLQILILLFALITLVASGQNPHEVQCNTIKNAESQLRPNLAKLWNIIFLTPPSRFLFLIACPIVLFFQIILIVTYYKYDQLRVKPGNIFCGLVIIQMNLNIGVFANALYRTIFIDQISMPDSYLAFCVSVGIFQTFFCMMHFMYLTMFMFYTIFLFRFSLKKKSKMFWLFLHVFVLIVSILGTIFLYLEDFVGLNFYGICGLTSTRKLNWNLILPGIQTIFSVCFIVLGIFTYWYFKKHMPEGGGFKKKKLLQSKIICMYVGVFSVFQTYLSIMNILLDLNCRYDNPIPELSIFITITNFLRIFQYAFLVFLILYNQKFRKKFKHILRSIFQFKQEVERSDSDLHQIIQIQDLIFNEKLLEMKQTQNEIDLLLLSQVYTIVTGIYVTYFEYFREFKEEPIKRINFRESVSFSIDNKSMLEYEREVRGMVKLKILSCDIIIHCPKIFQYLISLQKLQDIYQSFNLDENSKKLTNLVQGNGGKSGEFFFFSSDNKYVIKTITQDQYCFYKEHLEMFSDHFEENPRSLLAKIFGLITIKGSEMQRTYHLILMKNILGCSKSQIVRCYDLKGSKYDRKVLNDEEQMEINEIYSITLKDVDFLNHQVFLKINPIKAKLIQQSLRKDTTFLKSLNLLDYSLLVVRVKWQSPPKNPLFWGELQRIPHSQNPEQYYHIGLIDYMQKWDFQKKSQKWWKKLIGKKQISAQQPRFYQKRFMQFVDEILEVKQIKRNVKEKNKTGLIRQDRATTQITKQTNKDVEMQVKETRSNF